jgi:hypothetical protein
MFYCRCSRIYEQLEAQTSKQNINSHLCQQFDTLNVVISNYFFIIYECAWRLGGVLKVEADPRIHNCKESQYTGSSFYKHLINESYIVNAF